MNIASREGAGVARNTPLAQFEPRDSCVMCNERPARQCDQCRSSWYCSQECRESDQQSHELLCKDFAHQSSRPSANHRRAIFFPVDREQPEMIWIPCHREVESDTNVPWHRIELHPYLGTDQPSVGTMCIEHNPVRGRNLGSGMVYWAPERAGYSIAVKFRERFLHDGSVLNKSLLNSVRASGTPPHRWCGPIVAVRTTPSELYEDVTLADFRHIIDYMMSYRTTETRESYLHPEDRPLATIRGVKICCLEEQHLHGSEPYVLVDISRAHPTRLTYSRGDIAPVSRLLGMTLRLWRVTEMDQCANYPEYSEDAGVKGNPNASFLMMETDPKAPRWGWAPLEWNTNLGNVIAVRADDEDLTVDDVRMMCHFARHELQPLFEDALGSGIVPRTKQEVLNFATKENMQAYWYGRQACDETGARAKDVTEQ